MERVTTNPGRPDFPLSKTVLLSGERQIFRGPSKGPHSHWMVIKWWHFPVKNYLLFKTVMLF